MFCMDLHYTIDLELRGVFMSEESSAQKEKEKKNNLLGITFALSISLY